MTCEVAATFVIHVITALLFVMALLATAEIESDDEGGGGLLPFVPAVVTPAQPEERVIAKQSSQKKNSLFGF